MHKAWWPNTYLGVTRHGQKQGRRPRLAGLPWTLAKAVGGGRQNNWSFGVSHCIAPPTWRPLGWGGAKLFCFCNFACAMWPATAVQKYRVWQIRARVYTYAEWEYWHSRLWHPPCGTRAPQWCSYSNKADCPHSCCVRSPAISCGLHGTASRTAEPRRWQHCNDFGCEHVQKQA